ncbi:hypothetical protein WOLCODRAFT_105975 [Wolfiporia cocos MD-104 SS10]|uniref:Uncharacterized protein n=1 Tax=Wolfiporia cocos (strain MD-104) TaxID=742152 RepID=A0A2H3JTV6_WOLCO|nr:hypothetical protein WOLCODRAFT_105975 [Wolfiporia cocos MD-104 SS10]
MMGLASIWLFPFALVKTLVAIVGHALGFANVVQQEDHFAPHPSAGFEGYYSRTQLADGGTLAIVFCWVKHAKDRGNLVFLSYAPADEDGPPPFTFELYPERLDAEVLTESTEGLASFVLRASGVGTMTVTPTSVEYAISLPDETLTLNLRLKNRRSWSSSTPLEGPMGSLTHLSPFLPLNWHVYSTGSKCEYIIAFREQTRLGDGRTHLEKNWGKSFPSGWIWSQAFEDDERAISLAGGSALPGVQAYLVGYRSAHYQWDFRPPFSVSIGPLSPFMKVKYSSRDGTVDLEVRTWLRKLIVNIKAPVGSFLGLPAPLPEGHRPRFAFESFRATMYVGLYTRRWPWEEWTCVEADSCGTTREGRPSCALEFGGAFCHLVQEDKKRA